MAAADPGASPTSDAGWTPIFPLGTVLCPDGFLPLRIFETRYIDMTRRALKTREPFGVCLISEGREVGAGAIPRSIGTLAHINDCDMQQLGVLQVKARGGTRFAPCDGAGCSRDPARCGRSCPGDRMGANEPHVPAL